MKSLPPVIHKHEKKKKKKKDSKQLSVKRIKKLTHSYSKKKIKEPATVIKAARSSLTHQSIFIFFIFDPDMSKSKELLTFWLVSNFHVHNTFLPFIFYFIYYIVRNTIIELVIFTCLYLDSSLTFLFIY